MSTQDRFLDWQRRHIFFAGRKYLIFLYLLVLLGSTLIWPYVGWGEDNSMSVMKSVMTSNRTAVFQKRAFKV